MKSSSWIRGSLRTPLLSLSTGDTVAFIKTKLHHTAVGPTYWLMSVNKEIVYQVSEECFGHNLCRLVKTERPAHNQTYLDEQANSLLKNSVYRKYKKELAHLFVKRKKNDSICSPMSGLECIL
jgi:hypothetical protein